MLAPRPPRQSSTLPMSTVLSRRRRVAGATLFGVMALWGALVLGIVVGPADIGPVELGRIVLDRLTGAEPESVLRASIVWELRLPRVLTAAAVGAGLGLAGVVMQAVTRNPLADPYLLGLSSGASLGAVSVIVLGLGLLLPVAAFLGGARRSERDSRHRPASRHADSDSNRTGGCCRVGAVRGAHQRHHLLERDR